MEGDGDFHKTISNDGGSAGSSKERQPLAKGPSLELGSADFFTVNPKELHIRGLLGSGAQADVYKAEWTRVFTASVSSIVVAVKRLHADLGSVYRDREAITLVTDHPGLVKCFDATLDPPYLIVSEFCSGGSLFDLLYNSSQALSTRQRLKVLADVASAMRYLHALKPCILHRDLKSSNILLTKPIRSREQEPFAKVSDFGLSRADSTSSTHHWTRMTVGVGTWRWMAPEVFTSTDARTYDKTVDVFSFAMLMYEVLARKVPYSDKFPLESNDPRIGMHICMGLRPEVATLEEVPPSLIDLMQRGWAVNPDERPSFEEIDNELQVLLEKHLPPSKT